MNLEFPKCNQFILEIPIYNDDDTLIKKDDVDEIIMTCRKQPYESSPILFQKKLSDGTIEYNESTNLFETMILHKETKDLDYGTYGYDIEIRSGELIKSVNGKIKLTEKYTFESEG